MRRRVCLGLAVAGAALAVACSSARLTSSGGSGGASSGGSAGTNGGAAGTSSGGSGAGGTSGAGGSGATAGAGGSFPCTAAQCKIFDGPCVKGVCTATGCSTTPRVNGLPCNPANKCLTNATCKNGSCVGAPLGCASAGPCQQSACDPNTGACVTTAISGGSCDDGSACTAGDTCVAGKCQGTVIDLAKGATVTSSSGGSNGNLLANVNDGTCNAYWVANTDTSPGWVELDWPGTVTIGSMYVDTDDPSQARCHVNGTRPIMSATLQYWDGSGWVDAAPLAGGGDYNVSFTTSITTSRLRLANILSGPSTANYDSIIFEWWLFPSHGCTPPD